jgi:hypothetical protein
VGLLRRGTALCALSVFWGNLFGCSPECGGLVSEWAREFSKNNVRDELFDKREGHKVAPKGNP